jgi:hypothetical protein
MRTLLLCLLVIGSTSALAQSREPIQILPLRPTETAPATLPPPPARATPTIPRGDATWIVPPGTPAIDPILRPSVLQGPRGLQPDGRFIVTREMCRDQVGHTAGPDVAHRPGVDVLGRPVAPADLPGNRYDGIADRVVTGILADPTTRTPRAGLPLRGEAVVGRVEVDTRTGVATINGQPTGAGTPYGIDAATLAQLCAQVR